MLQVIEVEIELRRGADGELGLVVQYNNRNGQADDSRTVHAQGLPFVSEVDDEAARAGLRVGDTIVAIDGRELTSASELSALVPRAKKAFVFTVHRIVGNELDGAVARRWSENRPGSDASDIASDDGDGDVIEEAAADSKEVAEVKSRASLVATEAASSSQGTGSKSPTIVAVVSHEPHAAASSLDDQLLDAVFRDALGEIASLLRSGGNPNAVSEVDGSSLLHLACVRGKPSVVRLLLQGRAEVDIRAPDGGAPLGTACLSGKLGSRDRCCTASRWSSVAGSQFENGKRCIDSCLFPSEPKPNEYFGMLAPSMHQLPML